MTIDMDTPFREQFVRMISEVADVIATVDGINESYDRPFEQAGIFPAAWILPSSGEYTLIANGLIGAQHTILVEIMVSRNYGSQDIDESLPLAIKVSQALLDNPTLDGSVDGILSANKGPQIKCDFGPLLWGGTTGLGWRMEIEYHVQQTVTRTVPFERQMNLDGGYAYVDAVAELESIAQTVPGLEYSFYEPPESPSVFPFGVVFPTESDFSLEDATTLRGLHSFVIEIHTARSDSELDIGNSIELGPAFIQKLVGNPKLNDTVDTLQAINYTYGFLGYGNTMTLGWSIELENVKQRLDISTLN